MQNVPKLPVAELGKVPRAADTLAALFVF